MHVRRSPLAPLDLAVGGLCCATLGVAGLGAVAGFDAEDGPTLCPFALTTGAPCPLCGLTRSVAAAGRGDLAASVGLHPLGVVAIPLAAVLLALVANGWRRGDGVRWRLGPVAAGLAVLGLVWIHTLTIGEAPPL